MAASSEMASSRYIEVDDEDIYVEGASGDDRKYFAAKEDEELVENLQKMHKFESKDFDICDSILNKATNSRKSKKEYQVREILCWLLPCVIGIIMGFTAFVVDAGIEMLVTMRFERTKENIFANGGFVLPFLVFASFSFAFTCVAGSLVAYVEPLAAGSGIPEIKTYLNGVHLPNLLHAKTFIAKLCGIVFSIGAGLIAGKEGPFVHGGAIVGSGVSGLASRTFGVRAKGKYANLFRNDVDHREFTAIGTAAGVATAFGAPIGGALFTIEEGCSFYSTFIFWRCFIATCTGVLTLHTLVEFRNGFANLSSAKLGNHRDFGLYSDSQANYGANFYYYLWEFPVFVLIGIIGGLMGALFVSLNVKITHFRRKYIPVTNKSRRLYEVLCIAVLTSFVMLAFAYGSTCARLPTNTESYEAYDVDEGELSGDDEVTSLEEHRYFPRLWCKKGYYSSLGQLLMVPLSEALRIIIHLGETVDCSSTECKTVPLESLFTFVILAFLLMTLTYGVSAPTGLFVPSLAVGAAMGQIVGHIVQDAVGKENILVNLHTYAVLGAAASLGGATRMTLSITVLVMETTGALQLIVPLMLVIFVSKIVADFFNLGIYDTHILIRGAPLLEESGLSPEHRMLTEKVNIGDVAKEKLVALPSKVHVRMLFEILKNCKHNTFPIINTEETEKLLVEGSISRVVIQKLLQHNVGTYSKDKGEGASSYVLPDSQRKRRQIQKWLEPRIDGPVLPLEQLEYELQESERIDLWLDLSPFMQQNPFVLSPETSLARAYHLFRTMGLRHIFVGHSTPIISGIVTRKDLREENIKLQLSKKVKQVIVESPR